MSASSHASGYTSLAKNRLGVRAVVSFIVSAVAPLTVAAGVVTTLYAVTGLSAIGAAFIIVAIVLAIFATGYIAMAQRITNAGAFYAFISQGLGKPVGVGGAVVALVAYNALQVGLYGMFGPTFADYMKAKAGLDVPWWGWALAAWLIVAMFGWMRVEIAGWALTVLLGLEIVVLAVLTATGLADPAAGYSLASLSPVELVGAAGVGALLVTALLGFVGFEASTVFSEESRNPRRTVAVATYLSLALIVVVYAAASWSMSVHYGDDQVSTIAGEQGPGMLFGMGGPALGEIASVLFLTSLFAAMLSFHQAVGRYMYALGRELVIPRSMGRTYRRTGSPRNASVVQSIIGLAVIVVYAVAGWDPTVQLFFWLGTTGGFGVLLLLVATSVAIIVYFARERRGRESIWRTTIAPGVALVALVYMAYSGVANYATLLGVEPGSPVSWILPGGYAVAAAAGVLYGLWLRSAQPRIYQGIGLGEDSRAGQAGSRARADTPS